MPPKKRPRGYRTSITESLLGRVLKIVTDVVDWAQNATTIPTLYRRPPMLRVGPPSAFIILDNHYFFPDHGSKGLATIIQYLNRRSWRTGDPRRGRDRSVRAQTWGYLQ